MQGGSVNADGELSGDLSSGSGSGAATPDPSSPPGWVGADPCGVPEGADASPGDSAISLEQGDKPDKQYVGSPVATLPAFRMLPGGCSRVFLEMRGDVSVAENRAPGRLTYRISNVEVPERTNRFDLPTEHFATPVGRVQLLSVEGGAELVIELRSPAKSKATLRHSRRGMVLNVDFRSVDVAPGGEQSSPVQAGSASDPSVPR